MKKFLALALMGGLVAGCTTPKQSGGLKLNKAGFVKTIDGKKTNLYVLKNSKGVEVAITNYGARAVGISVPDRNGKFEDVIIRKTILGTAVIKDKSS